jgi:prepilin-type N-terminal cleavage/methylation domain-containing protein
VKLRDRLAAVAKGRQEGFTLVEMAIVLVIIGLIIGGILKGQEIVNNGRVKAQVAQIDSIKAAIQTFLDKYGFYPGDDNQVVTQFGLDTSFNGSGDGIVSTSPPAPDLDSATENNNTGPNAVWFLLEAANLLSGVQSSSNGAQTNANHYNLLGKINASYLTFADFAYVVSGTTTTNKSVRISGTSNPSTPTPVMREQDASQIDLKYDDGQPTTGSIVVTTYSSGSNCCGAVACTTSTTTSYGVVAGASTSGNYCALLWDIQ